VRDLPERLGVAEAVGDARVAAASIFAEQPLYDPGVVRVGLEAADVQRGGLARPTLESLEVGFVLEVEDVDGLDEALAGPGPVPGEGGFEGVLAGEGSFEAAGIDEANGLELRERDVDPGGHVHRVGEGHTVEPPLEEGEERLLVASG